MTIEERAADLYEIVVNAGFPCLLMGGHAVRHYGLDRRTVDFDFQVAIEPAEWPELSRRMEASARLQFVREGESWRREDFRRFVIGTLPDGRDERIEFWRRNHLLPPFSEAWSRREEGLYGGRTVFEHRNEIAEATASATHPVTRAFLAPYRRTESDAADLLARALATATPGSAKHMALVEAVRNRYRMSAAAADRARVTEGGPCAPRARRMIPAGRPRPAGNRRTSSFLCTPFPAPWCNRWR